MRASPGEAEADIGHTQQSGETPACASPTFDFARELDAHAKVVVPRQRSIQRQ